MFRPFFRPFVAKRVALVKQQWQRMRDVNDVELLQQAKRVRERAVMGAAVDQIVVDAYALVCEAARRSLGIEFYDVQILGGLHLAQRSVIEMETGQGKSLTATLPLFLYACYQQGAHLATSNDYLAKRDAETMRPLFERLGMRCGFVVDGMNDHQRRQAYACDITYSTASELGFDFLRDRLKRRAIDEHPILADAQQAVGRDLYFLLADEADALMIDEANMPMVIGAHGQISEQQQALYQWATDVAHQAIENVHFKYDLRDRKVELLPAGRQWLRECLQNKTLACGSILDLYEKAERAILVHRDFHRDQHYIVRDSQIVLINEATGRLGEGRQWQDGIHQAIESAEGLTITAPTTHAAKLTVQGLFLSYRHLAGMTGTAAAARQELSKVYKTNVVRVPPRHPSLRRPLPTRTFDSEQDKWDAIVAESMEMRRQGRCVLIGTRSVEKSQRLSDLLTAAGLPHNVLHARHHAAEAETIAAAGRSGQITVATSMAGRGTDIALCETTLQAGGLHVILSEYHDSPRQDMQLAGRCARQGQPGTYRLFLSPEDAIVTQAYGPIEAERLQKQRGFDQSKLLAAAQAKLQQRLGQQRMTALYQEKRRLRSLWEMGRDPLLDVM